MRVGVFAVGRMKSGPEKELADRYLDRFAKAGRSLGLEFSGVAETAESRAASPDLRRREEAERLAERLAPGGLLVLLDERGDNMDSERFAAWLGSVRDRGAPQAVLALGGPDGHDAALREKAALVLAFGVMTWPHQLARIMLAEQLYRAATILSGHPYHRA